MSVPSFIYQQWLDTCESESVPGKAYSFFFKNVRRFILRFSDPPCRMPVRNRQLWMPFSHQLPRYAWADSQYDALLPRLAAYLRQTRGRVCGIDIGANIGDTILACDLTGADQFLAIEPGPLYFTYLERNLGTHPNVRRLQFVCGNKDANSNFHITVVHGTAQIREAGAGETAIAAARLDTLLQTQADFSGCNFLKIDTDGHDFDVIRGARELIGRARPAVLFECDFFENPTYSADIEEIFQLFAAAGYRHALIYDNAGYLLTCLDPARPAAFNFALFHKLVTGKYYFDVLMLPEDGAFVRQELAWFARLAPGDAGKAAAKKIADLIQKDLAPV